MQKVSYIGNGTTTEFTFNFPYFENSNIVVTKNGATATGYNIVGTSGGLDADIPYTGGKVVFETAPTIQDTITIMRCLPLNRVADYQPLVKIDPTTLNQDMNYMMEVLKDLQDELDDFSTQYADIVDKESTTVLLARISAIHDEIVAIDNKITALGDISTLRSSVATNTENITKLTNAENLTNTGKQAIVRLGMPDYSTSVNREVGTTYTAETDGIVEACIQTNGSCQMSFTFNGVTTRFAASVNSQQDIGQVYKPVKAGDTYAITRTYGSGVYDTHLYQFTKYGY